jgi:hypothetical protein
MDSLLASRVAYCTFWVPWPRVALRDAGKAKNVLVQREHIPEGFSPAVLFGGRLLHPISKDKTGLYYHAVFELV